MKCNATTTWKGIAKGRDVQSPLRGTLATCPLGELWAILHHAMHKGGIQHRIPAYRLQVPTLPLGLAFLVAADMHKHASVAGSGHGCGSSRMQRYDLPCICRAKECLPSNSVTGMSARSERSLELERYFVKMSATFLSPPIFSTTTLPSSILSWVHSVLDSRCFTFPNPFLVRISFAAEESVDKVMLRSRLMSFAIPLIPKATHMPLTTPQSSAWPLGGATMVCVVGQVCNKWVPCVQASVGGPPQTRAPSVVGVDVHLEVGLDMLPCDPQHLSGVLPQVSAQLSNIVQADMYGLDIRLHISLLANYTSTLSAARKLSLAATDLYLYASSWSNFVFAIDIYFVASHIRPVCMLEHSSSMIRSTWLGSASYWNPPSVHSTIRFEIVTAFMS